MAFDEMTATAMREAARLERRIAELEAALRELYESDAAPYPDEAQGAAAQDDWAERRNNARRQARDALRTPSPIPEGCTPADAQENNDVR